jgi:hypothetical protein
MQARAALLVRVSVRQAYPGVAGGRQWLDRRRGWSIGNKWPGEMHAEEMAFTVESMASRRAPVMDGEIVELGHAWIKREQGEI